MSANFTSKRNPAYVNLVDADGNEVGTVDNPLVTSGGGTPADGSITTEMLENLAVTGAKLADGSVTSAKIGAGAVGATKLGTDVSNLITARVPKANFTSISPLADPATATLVQTATLLNTILASLKT